MVICIRFKSENYYLYNQLEEDFISINRIDDISEKIKLEYSGIISLELAEKYLKSYEKLKAFQ